jgi:hypothetical protein
MTDSLYPRGLDPQNLSNSELLVHFLRFAFLCTNDSNDSISRVSLLLFKAEILKRMEKTKQ